MTFDPFMSLSVPIPRNLRRIPIFFVPHDPSLVPLRYLLQLPPEANLELLKASVAKKTGMAMKQVSVQRSRGGRGLHVEATVFLTKTVYGVWFGCHGNIVVNLVIFM